MGRRGGGEEGRREGGKEEGVVVKWEEGRGDVWLGVYTMLGLL